MKLVRIGLLVVVMILTGVAENFTWNGILPGVTSMATAAAAGNTTSVACGTTSTQIYTVGDLGVGVARHFMQICNNGPGIAYIAIGTSNAATTTNGLPLGPMGCLPPWTTFFGAQGVVSLPPQNDVACIADPGSGGTSGTGGTATANIVAVDY